MTTIIEKVVPWEILEQCVRETTLLEPPDGRAIYPYEEATISLREVEYASVSPTSLYVLRRRLAALALITHDLSLAGYHPLELDCGLVIDHEGRRAGLIPPIVEETATDGQYVLDGAHRTSMGRWCGRTHFLAIHIVGVRPDCPPYAFPNSWDDIRVEEQVPRDPARQRYYRRAHYRALFRDFGLLNKSLGQL